jgi:hypothetical protein
MQATRLRAQTKDVNAGPCTYSVHSGAHGSLHRSHWCEQFLRNDSDAMHSRSRQHTCARGRGAPARGWRSTALARQPAASDPDIHSAYTQGEMHRAAQSCTHRAQSAAPLYVHPATRQAQPTHPCIPYRTVDRNWPPPDMHTTGIPGLRTTYACTCVPSCSTGQQHELAAAIRQAPMHAYTPTC